MNTFEEIFEFQQAHQSQHLTKERNKQIRITLVDDPSCIIYYPAPLPTEQPLVFCVFFKWLTLYLELDNTPVRLSIILN